MPRALSVNPKQPNLYLEYDTFGSPKNPAILLVMGLATQMTAWRPAFCQILADKGYYVIRFDNRDIGLSSHLDDFGPPPLVTRVIQHKFYSLFGCPEIKSAYTLEDMAEDSFG